MGIQTSSINNGPTAGFKNAIINGNFDFWQRGTTSTVTTAGTNFLSDRWSFNTQGNTITTSRQAFSLGQTAVPNEPAYFHRMAVTANVAAQPSLEQRIEGVRTFSGQQITLSFWAKGAASFTLNYFVAQGFGTGGSPSSAVGAASGTVSLTTSWQRFTITATMPSISGKTIGTDNNDYLQIGWQMPASANNTFDLAQVQVEAGPVATTFERRPIGTELALCQRYFAIWQYPGRDTPIVGQNNADGSVQITPFELPVTMRSYPSSMTYAGAVISGNLRFGTGSGTLVTSATLNSAAIDTSTQTNRATINFGSRAGWIEAASVRSNNNVEADRPKFYFSAEL